MPVPFDYYWNLRKEAKEVSEKYYARNLPERFNNFKADKILYEKKAKTVKFHPYIGRYDKYLYPFCPGRKYKPGKLLTEAPDYLSYAYYYKEDKPVFVRTWDDPEMHELEYRKSPKQLIYKPQRRFYRTIHYITDNGFVSFDQDGVPISIFTPSIITTHSIAISNSVIQQKRTEAERKPIRNPSQRRLSLRTERN